MPLWTLIVIEVAIAVAVIDLLLGEWALRNLGWQPAMSFWFKREVNPGGRLSLYLSWRVNAGMHLRYLWPSPAFVLYLNRRKRMVCHVDVRWLSFLASMSIRRYPEATDDEEPPETIRCMGSFDLHVPVDIQPPAAIRGTSLEGAVQAMGELARAVQRMGHSPERGEE